MAANNIRLFFKGRVVSKKGEKRNKLREIWNLRLSLNGKRLVNSWNQCWTLYVKEATVSHLIFIDFKQPCSLLRGMVGPSSVNNTHLRILWELGFVQEASQEQSWPWLLPGGIGGLDFMWVPAVWPEEQQSVKNGLHVRYEWFPFWKYPQDPTMSLRATKKVDYFVAANTVH